MSFLEGVAPTFNPRRLHLTRCAQSLSIVKVSPFWKEILLLRPCRQSCFLRGVLFSSLQVSLLALGQFTPWCRGALRFLYGDINVIFLWDDDLSYFQLVRLRRRLILRTLSLARRLIFLGLLFARSSLGGHPIVLRWTGYIRLRRCPTMTPQVLICLEGCRLSGYSRPLKLMNVANEAGQ